MSPDEYKNVLEASKQKRVTSDELLELASLVAKMSSRLKGPYAGSLTGAAAIIKNVAKDVCWDEKVLVAENPSKD